MKRINAIVLLLVCLLNFTAVPFIYAADEGQKNEYNPYAKKQELLIALDLMSYNSEGEIDNSKELTRAEFVDVIAKFFNVNPTVMATSSYFYDVPVDAWYTNSLNLLTDYTIIHQDDSKMFYPDRVISVNEAIKMVVCMLGYRVFAEQQGPFPDGYIAAASKLGLLYGMPAGQNFTNAHMTVLLYNAIKAETADVQITGNGAKIKPSGKNILEAKRDIYKSDGVIESVYGLSAYGDDVSKKEKVIIGKRVFKTDNYENVIENFGRRVLFYFQKLNNNEYKLIYTEPYYDDDTLEISGEDFEKYDKGSNTISYLVKEKSKRVTLSNTATVFKNGVVVKANVADSFNITNGEIKLIDSNDDKKYDLVCIYDFKTVVANNVNSDTKVLTYKLVSNATTPDEEKNKNGVFDFSNNQVDYLTVYSSVGTIVDFAAITSNSVLDIAVSDNGKSATIFINADIFEGTLTNISESEEEVYIDGNKYDFYPSILDIYYLKLGDNGKFKVNKYGKVSYFEKITKAGEKNPAVYLVDVKKYHDGIDGVFLKYYDSTGNFHSKLVSDNLKLDGEKLTDNVYTQLSKLKRNIIVLKVNDEDEITKIDSPKQTTIEDDSSLNTLFKFSGTGIKWNSTTKMFDKNIVVSNDAVVFVVPPILPEYTDFALDEQSYSIGALTDFISNDANNVDCYKIGSSSYCNIVVLYKYKYQNPYRNRYIMVTKVTETLDAYGERITRITGYQSGQLVSYDVSNEYKVGSSPDSDIVVEKGDIITVGRKDNDGLVGNVEVYFDASRNWSGVNQICLGGYMFDSYANRNYDAIWYCLERVTDIQAYTRFTLGCPTEIEGNIIKFKYPSDFKEGADHKAAYSWRKWTKPTDYKEFDEMAIVKSTTPIIVYDMETNTIESGTITDICAADTYSCPSQIFFDMRWGEVVSVFVINNNDKAWTKPDVLQ